MCAVLYEGGIGEEKPIIEIEMESSSRELLSKSLLDILSEKGNSERLKEKNTVSNLIVSFAVDYGSENVLRERMHVGESGNELVMDMRSFVRNLDDIKSELVDLEANTEWIDKIMNRVKNYVMYGASNLTELKKDEEKQDRSEEKIDIILDN